MSCHGIDSFGGGGGRQGDRRVGKHENWGNTQEQFRTLYSL